MRIEDATGQEDFPQPFIEELDITDIQPKDHANVLAEIMKKHGLDPTRHVYRGSHGDIDLDELLGVGHDRNLFRYDGRIYAARIEQISEKEYIFPDTMPGERGDPFSFVGEMQVEQERFGITVNSRICVYALNRIEIGPETYGLPHPATKALIGVIQLKDTKGAVPR